MKKNIILLLASSLLSIGTTQAATKNITKCYGNKLTMEASTTGNSYQWYENGRIITGATNKTYVVNSVSANAKYECKITTNGTSANTGNLISLGNFEFNNESQYKRYKQHISDPVRGDSYDIEYQLDQLNLHNQANSGEYCTSNNPNNIKPQYFSPITAKVGSKMLVVDGAASSSEFKVFHVRDLKLKGGVTYQFSCYAANIDQEYFSQNHGTQSLPKIKFVIEADGHGTQVLGGGYMTLTDQLGVWKEYKATFKPNNDCNWAHITIINTTNTTVAGNDFVLDGIYFGAEQTTTGSTTTDEFNVTVYDTFTYKFETEAVCPGAQATIKTTLVPVHNGTLDPNITKEWIKYSDRSFASDKQNLVVTAPNAVGSVTYELTSKGQYCGNLSQTTSITVKDCGREVPINHPAVTYCTNQNVTLKCDKTGSSVVWSHDASLTNTEITVVSNSAVNKEDTYKCTITTTENGNTVTYIETFTVKTRDCSVLVEPTMCNTITESTLTTSKVGDSYLWKLPDGSTKSTTTNTLTITHTNTNVGDKFSYSCEIRDNSMLIATELFDVTIIDCHVETDDEEELQVKEDGSIKLLVPEENRCSGCSYNWYKKKEDGTKGEAVVKNAGEEAWEHTVYNAVDDEYICEIIAPNGNKHVQSYTVKVYTPKTSEYCYTANTDEQKEIITLTQGDKDEYEWYWMKGNQEIPFPEGSVSTENNSITLDVNYFVKDNNSNFPVKVHIVEKFAHKVETTTTETPEEDTTTDVVPDVEDPITPPVITPEPPVTPETPIAPAPDPVAPAAIPPIQINTSALSISSLNIINSGKSYSYEHTFEDANTSTVNIEIGQDYQYTEYFAPKVGGMTEHAGVVRLTNTGINGCHAYKGDDPNNEYFFEVDGGDKAGPIFSIVQEGKIIKGKKYILRFLARETSTDPSISGPTTNPAKIDFQITLNGNTYGVTNQIVINKQDWTAHVFNYIANEDADNVILTLSNYNTDSGHNDFAIDEITFALADPSIAPENRSLKFRNLADENEGIVDEDGDGYVMWRDEHILYIYPNTTQTFTESSSPNVEFEKEITLPTGEKINFRYDPNIYDGAMTKYEANDYKTDEHGCTHYAYFTLNLIEIEPDKFFTPNGDGVNDKWMVEGIDTAPNAHVMIYDRYSKLLYKCKGSDFQGWDGNYNGHGMVQDDYWYVILVPETNETISGHFTLKR